jgi:hypothetical protein
MGKINTSNIDKNPFTSEYTRKFGKGAEGKNNMAFALLKYILIGMVALFTIAIIANTIWHAVFGVSFWNEFWSAKPVESAFAALWSAFMLILGYLFKGTSE